MTHHKSLFFLVLALIVVAVASAGRTTVKVHNGTECIDGPSIWYEGSRNYTRSGITCQRWDVTTPHKPIFTPKDGGKHNFCRNPDHDQMGTWCYTTNSSVKWEYCEIPKCPDDSIVAWTSYNVNNRTAKVLSFEADPEIVRQRAGASPSVSIKPVFASGRVPAEYWTLASDYGEQKIFFLDYRSSYFGVHDLKTNTTSIHLEGMGAGVEGIAYDWATKNVYWTDSEQNWVMVSDSNFKHYTPIYRPDDETPYAIAVHARKRLLFISLFKTMGSKIITLDMAGNNRKELFNFPDVFDVTGLTIDYTDDKLYWTDFTGFGSLVVCSGLDGTNKTRKYFSTSSILWGVASYLNYIYATDVRTRFMVEGKYYYVWWISKTQTADSRLKLGNYRLSEKPRGITVLSKNEEYSLDKDDELGSCDNASPCDHLCLPMVNKTRVCACSVGYELQNGVQCVTPVAKTDRLLLADQGQAKIFQVGLSSTSAKINTTVVVPLGMKSIPYAVDVSASTNLMFWSDIKTKTINRASWDGSFSVTILKNKTVKALAVEPRIELVFFADDHSQYIYVAKQSGLYFRPIMTEKSNVSRIGKIALDYTKRFVYWSDTHSTEGKGQILRMRYDGTDRKVILDGLHWPEAITVDQEGSRLFVADSKLGMIYEYKTDVLDSLLMASGAENKTWQVSKQTDRSNVYISDIKVSGGFLYMFDKVTTHIERFALGDDTENVSVGDYGPHLFYRIHSFAVYSNTLGTYIKQLQNPCRSRFVPCHHMCVAISNTDSKCICQEGYELNGGSSTDCSAVGGQDDPPEPMNCPDDVVVRIGPCQTSSEFQWDEIVWLDDRTARNKLVVNGPQTRTLTVRVGETQISYTATDEAGNVGECSFAVTVVKDTCPPIPAISSSSFVTTPQSCKLGVLSFDVSCENPDYKISADGNGLSYDKITIRCQNDIEWVPSTNVFHCTKPMTPPTTTPTTIPTTTPTTTPTTIPPTTPTTREPATPPKPIPTQAPTNPTTTKATTVAPTRPKPVTTTTKAPETPGVQPGAQAQLGGLTGGDQAAIAIVVLIVLGIVLAVGVFYWRRSGTGSFAFPIFWKTTTDDQSTLENNEVEGSHSYSVFH